MRRRLARPLREDGARKSRRANGFCTDGSAVPPKDRSLRRVDWSVAWRTDGPWRSFAGNALGAQTVPRDELLAATRVAEKVGSSAAIRSDCHRVVNGCAALRLGLKALGPPNGPENGLRGRVLRAGASGVHRVPAHCSREEARAGGHGDG